MRKIHIVLTFALLIFFTVPSFAQEAVGPTVKTMKIHFIDAEEGDSTLIVTPHGKTVLVDAGTLISGYHVYEYLKENGINKLDYFILTHPHIDHMGGAFFILQMMEVDNVYDNGQGLGVESKLSDIYRWYDDLVRSHHNYGILEADDNFSLDGVNFTVILPAHISLFADWNVNSLVLMVDYKDFSCLLAADIPIQMEKRLLDENINLEADVLKVSHHGEDDASSIEFLQAVYPKVSVISVNKNNIRGYPSERVLRRLEEIESETYRTDVNGDIVVSIDENKKITIETSK